MDGDGKSSASSSAEKATGGVSRRLNSKRKNKANCKRYHISKKEAEVERLRVLRRRYYMKNYPELGRIGMYARIALKHFNEENVAQGFRSGVDYELVEEQKMNSRLWYRWMHVNFKAKPKNVADTDAVLFFGEVREPMGGDVINCCDLNTGSCLGCRVIHPSSGFTPRRFVSMAAAFASF